ncbi:hypothetical protein [Larsenimonas rhizosphaerae]|uniref:Uncharacterized protein n=1 Tax=Larsenimonas rhizosphaerae TaxID=2944682 RepID=A0AA42CX34_9GAMM|nr:hypothetical protein [Larsenimonas rhizosphaerae]MCM2130711.1 hypothetical protein [Larsenimonas rhizosphaerae]MCX2523415.1 hypothetical protein [Larsenimonas rhizosphaerae]
MYRVRCAFQPSTYAKPKVIQMKLIPKVGEWMLLDNQELEVQRIIHTPQDTDIEVQLQLKVNLNTI